MAISWRLTPRTYDLLLVCLMIVDVAGEVQVRSDASDLGQEIQCYSIPYGVVGFVQHITTYYKIAILHRIRRPLMPWMRLEAPDKWNTIITCTQGLINLIISIVTIGRCNKSWELICMVFWKLLLAITLTLWSAQASSIARKLAKGEDYEHGGRDGGRMRVPVWWLLIYVAALAIGLPGLFTLVKQNYSNIDLQTVTGVFWGICGGLIFLRLICGCCNEMMPEYSRFAPFPKAWHCDWGIDQDENMETGFMESVYGIVILIVVVAALYSDWALAVMVDNIPGLPKGETTAALYWIYFIGKELPFLAW